MHLSMVKEGWCRWRWCHRDLKIVLRCFKEAYKFLEGLIFKICLVYVDDILIFGETKEELKRNENLVRKRLKKYNLEENKENGVYLQQEVTFFWFKISLNKIKLTTERFEGIVNYIQCQIQKDNLGVFCELLDTIDYLLIQWVKWLLLCIKYAVNLDLMNGMTRLPKHSIQSKQYGK